MEKKEEWMEGMKENMERKEEGGESDGEKDIVGGIWDIEVEN